MSRRFAIVALLFLVFFLLPGQVRAQTPEPPIDRLQVDIWPEYDRPTVLVIYRINLSANTSLPVSLSLRIPKQAVKPASLTMRDVDGMLYNLDYYTQQEPDWVRVTFETSSPEIILEYYDPDLVKNGLLRTFTYLWPGDLAVEELTLQVQQPVNAIDIQISPQTEEGQPGYDGLTYFRTEVGAVAIGQNVALNLSYVKNDDTLSASLQPVMSVKPIDPMTEGRKTYVDAIPWSLAILGFILIIAGWVWYRKASGQPQPPAPTRKKQEAVLAMRSAGQDRPTGPLSGLTGTYCHKCGRRALKGDVFCRACGGKIRYE
jgi:hypothetical protein